VFSSVKVHDREDHALSKSGSICFSNVKRFIGVRKKKQLADK
jgi:hypothetical protein